MKRPRSRATAPSISLFPFLAVLLCTMGVLIVVLVVLVQQGKLRGEEAGALAAATEQQDAELAQWQAEQLQIALANTQQALEEANRELSIMDSAVREAEQELQSLESRARNLIQVAQSPTANLDTLKSEIAAVQRQLADLQLQAQEAKGKPPARRYAVIPYLGKHTTFRPPVYIECRADKVIIQPENIVFTEQDFAGSLGPTNPLASVLRATREHIRSTGPAGDAANSLKEPYPLLLVRPDGIAAFYVAREALKSFGTQFGYELIESDWELKFPSPDANLANKQLAALTDARERNQALVAAAPALYGDQEGSVFRAAVGDAGPSEGGYLAGDSDSVPLAADAGSGHTTGDVTNGVDVPHGDGGLGTAPEFGTQEGVANASIRGRENELATTNNYQPLDDSEFMGNDTDAGKLAASGDINTGSSGLETSAQQERGNLTQSALADTATKTANASVKGIASGQQEVEAGELPPDSQQNIESSYAEQGRNTAGSMVDAEKQDAAQHGPPTEVSFSRQQQPPQPAQKPRYESELDKRCMARKLGRDWALPKTARGAVPVTRPLKAICTTDHFILLDDRGETLATIPWQADTSKVAYQIVNQVWQTAQQWGPAGSGMHWRPTISSTVEPGAESQFRDLDAALMESGLTMQRVGAAPFFVRKGSATSNR